jgi:hypothetical protein
VQSREEHVRVCREKGTSEDTLGAALVRVRVRVAAGACLRVCGVYVRKCGCWCVLEVASVVVQW